MKACRAGSRMKLAEDTAQAFFGIRIQCSQCHYSPALDLAQAAKHRAGMGFFRDRRPQLYGRIAQDI